MRAIRLVVCLAAVSGLLVLVPILHRSPQATYGGADLRLLALEVGAAIALLLVAAWGPAGVAQVLVAVVGAAWLLPEMAGGAGVSLTARALSDSVAVMIPAVLLVALVLRRGAPAGPLLWPVRVAVGGAVVAGLARLLLVDPFQRIDCWRTCEHNPLFVGGGLGPAVELAGLLGVVAGVLWTAVLVLQEGIDRRAVARGARADLAGWCILVGLVVGLFVRPSAVASATEDHLALAVFVLTQVAAVAWLAALAWESWQRRRLESRLAHLVDLLGVTSDPEILTESLRSAVRDPDLRLEYWAPSRQGYVDSQGRQAAGAEPRPGQRVTTVARRGQPIAAVTHAGRVDSRRLERAVGPVLRLAMENAQLRAAALAELDELNRSRVRVVQRGELERRRLERNLHDGAQQRVVSLALLVRVLVGGASLADRESGRRAEALTRTLVEELRRVARGIYPAVLADAGLAGAVVDLAEQSSDLPVVVAQFPEGRYPGTIETTAYLVARAGIADARSRGATCATVSGLQVDGRLRVSVSDDAGPAPDGVVAEFADQVSALGGTLESSGPPGRRRVEVVLPCVS